MIVSVLFVTLAADPADWAQWEADAGPPDGGPEQTDALAAKQQVALEQLTGFQKLAWGADEAAVLKVAPKARRTKRSQSRISLTAPMAISGLAATVDFVIESGRLVIVYVDFDNRQKGYATASQACDAVNAALTEKYGPSSIDEGTLGGSQRFWNGSKTVIGLTCDAHPISPRTKVALVYFDRQFAEKKHEVKSDDL